MKTPSLVQSDPTSHDDALETAARWTPEGAVGDRPWNAAAVRAAAWTSCGLHALLGSAKDRFGVLMYHRVAPLVPGVAPPTINVTPGNFERQLTGLVDQGASFWSLAQVLDAIECEEPLDDQTTVVTFDDGFQSVLDHALPVLQKLKIPATVFLNTQFLESHDAMPFDHWGVREASRAPEGHYRPLTIRQCHAMQDTGLIDFGAHTHSHQDFRGRPQAFLADLRTNIEFLREHLGVERPTFAFPYGIVREGFADASLTAAARQIGVRCALNTRHETLSPGRDPFLWGRIHVADWDTPRTLAAKLGGRYAWFPALKDRWSRWRGNYKPQYDAPHLPKHAPLLPERPPHAQVDVSVVMPTYNRAHWVGGALESLAKLQTDGRFTYEIVVIDNRSGDNTREVVEAFAAQSPAPVRYVFESTPGDAPTRNAGLRVAEGEWFAFFDDDQFAEPDWLLEFWKAKDQCPAKILGGPVLLDLDEQELQRLGPECRKVLREIAFYDRLQPYQGKHLPGAGNAFVAREAMEAVGCFDASMNMGGSDSDFFMRARQSGFEMWYSPHAKIRHRIAKARTSPAFFRWESLSGGAGHAAHFDQERFGALGQTFMCGLRLAHAALVTTPKLTWAWLKGDAGGVLGQRCKLWRAEGYLRRTLQRLAPETFAQEAFFESLDFRKGRELCAEDAQDVATSTEGSDA